MELYCEKNNLKVGAAPADINGVGIVGSRVSVQNTHSLAAVITLGAGAVALTVSAQQHDAATAGNSKALKIKKASFYKVDAELVMTKVGGDIENPADDFTIPVGASGIAVIEFEDTELDNNNGFSYISVNVADPAASKIAGLHYVLNNMGIKPAYSVEI